MRGALASIGLTIAGICFAVATQRHGWAAYGVVFMLALVIHLIMPARKPSATAKPAPTITTADILGDQNNG